MSKFNYVNIREMFITSDMAMSSYIALLITTYYIHSSYYIYNLIMAGVVILSNGYNHYLNIKKKFVIKDKKYISVCIMSGAVLTHITLICLTIQPNIFTALPFYIALLIASVKMGIDIKKAIKTNHLSFTGISKDKEYLLLDLYTVTSAYDDTYHYSTNNNYYYKYGMLFKTKKDLIKRINGIDLNLVIDTTESKNLNKINNDDLLIAEMVKI